jgi:xylulokinase
LQNRSLLSIDIGTSKIKVGIFSETGERIALASLANRTISQQPFCAEQDPEAWWASVVTLIRRLLRHRAVKSNAISAIAVTGQMHAPVLVNAQGRSLGRCQIWTDSRAQAETKEISERIPERLLYRITGYRLSPYLTAPRLIWIKKRQRNRYLKTKHVLLPKDYIRARLTGDMSTDWTDADGTGLFDLRKKVWSNEIFRALKLDLEKMPTIRAPNEVVGRITGSAAKTTGLKKGIPVVAGSGDDVVQLGTGVKNHELAVNLGTSCSTFLTVLRPTYDPKSRLECVVGFSPNRWLLSGTTASAGSSVDWVLENSSSVTPEKGEGNKYKYSHLPNSIENSPTPSDLIFLPFLNGERTPIWDSHATGAILGLTLRHTRNDLILAVLEGVCFSVRSILELTEKLGGKVLLLRVAGGATSSLGWMQLLANITNRHVVIPRESEATLLGGAMLAAVGSGLHKSIGSAAELQGVRKHFYPNSASARKYEKVYEAYVNVSPFYLRRLSE